MGKLVERNRGGLVGYYKTVEHAYELMRTLCDNVVDESAGRKSLYYTIY